MKPFVIFKIIDLSGLFIETSTINLARAWNFIGEFFLLRISRSAFSQFLSFPIKANERLEFCFSEICSEIVSMEMLHWFNFKDTNLIKFILVN